MTDPLSRRLAVIMFTDLVGYSALAQKDESLAIELLKDHRQILRPLIAQHAGREIKTIGDAFLVEFASALEAARCAVEMQRAMTQYNSTARAERRVQLRIGLHLGDVVSEESDIHGDGVNIAARIEPLADPGGICVSEDVARQIQNKIDQPVIKLGRTELKNIDLPVEVYKILLPWEESQLPSSDRVYYRAAPSLKADQQFGPYRIIRLLGKGGMGDVYEAEHLENGRRVALKVLGESLGTPIDRQRFLREGRLAASINHPNTVYIFGTEKIEGMPVISMELAPGGTLKDLLKPKGPMEIKEAIDAICQVIAGLEAAQEAGILHRDVKPSNCFVESDGTVKIGDFGLSISTLSREEPQLTVSGTFLGTPSYASPEQLRGEPLDVRSDIYSVGATLYHLLTGQAPFEDSNMMKLLTKIAQQAVPSARGARSEIPKGLDRIIQRCLEKNPSRRYANYAELRKALQPFRSSALASAGLVVRFLAGILDLLLLILLVVAFAGLILKWEPALPFQEFGILALVTLAYFASVEAIWGRSLGKAICRLRIVAGDGSPPSRARLVLRAFLFSAFLTLSVLGTSLMVDLCIQEVRRQVREMDPSLVMQVLPLLAIPPICLFTYITVRRRNGYAALHDILTGTRVAQEPELPQRPAISLGKAVTEKIKTGAVLGPYEVLESIHRWDGEQLLLANDPRLRRHVWIHLPPTGAPPVARSHRDVGRAGRLRWLNGKRTETECWDAYEAVEGQSLLDMSRQRQSWRLVRHWLRDLAKELAAASKDGSLPDSLSLGRIWIGRDGRARILDFPAPGTTGAAHDFHESTFRSCQAFLHQVAEVSLGGGVGAGGPLPLYARSLLENLQSASFKSSEELNSRLDLLIENEPSVSRMTRFAQIAFILLTLILMTALFVGTGRSAGPDAFQGLCLALAWLSWPALLTAVIFRGGLILWLTGVEVVSAGGKQGSGIVALRRALVAWWLPWLVVPIAFALDANVANPLGRLMQQEFLPAYHVRAALFHTIIVAFFLAGALSSVFNPERSIADRLARTALVPRALAPSFSPSVRSRRMELLVRWASGTIVALVVLLFGAGVYVRQSGLTELNLEIEKLRAAGEPTDWKSFIKPVRVMDRDLEDRFYGWQRTFRSHQKFFEMSDWPPERWKAWLMGEDPKAPPDLVQRLASVEPFLSELRALLSQPELISGARGWTHRNSGKPPWEAEVSSLLHMRSAVHILGCAAHAAEDPRPMIRDMDRVVEIQEPTGTLIDCLIAIALQSIRDVTYLQLALRDHLPEPAASRWVSNAPPVLEWASVAFRGEQLAILEEFRRFGVVTGEAGGSVGPQTRGIGPWLRGPHEMAEWIRYCNLIIAWADQPLTDPPSFPKIGFDSSSLWTVIIAARECLQYGRLCRLAVRVMEAARRRGRVPLDEKVLIGWLGDKEALASRKNFLPIRYEHLARDRFRISLDMSANHHSFIRSTPPRFVTHFGEPPSEPFWKNNNSVSLEIKIPHLR